MKKFFAIINILLILSTVPPTFADQTRGTASSFPDISNNIHADAIIELFNRGIVQGYIDGTFRPDATINRAEFLKILTEIKGDYSPSRDPSGYDIEAPVGLDFSDIRSRQWYVPYVRNALKLEIISGYDDGTFRPEAAINLAEALKIIFRTFEIPTVQFIRAPDHWYDYYTTGLDADFETETHLSPIADIGKRITRGEMASLLLYFEAKAKLLSEAQTPPEVILGPFYVNKPLILEKHFEDGVWTLKGFVMFSNGCYKAETSAIALPSQPEQVRLSITEVSDPLGMCLPIPQEHFVSFDFTASAQAQIGDVMINGKAQTAIIHDPDQEALSNYAPITLRRSETKNATLLAGTYFISSCNTPVITSTVYDGPHQQVEIDITEDVMGGRRCSRGMVEVPLEVSIPSLGNQATIFRARINGEPVSLIIQ